MPRWTDKARNAQSKRARTNAPWQYATGPKSKGGKAKSALNATKHGQFSRAGLYLRRLLALQNTYRRFVIKNDSRG